MCVCVCAFFVRLSKRQSEFRNRGYLALKGIFLARLDGTTIVVATAKTAVESTRGPWKRT